MRDFKNSKKFWEFYKSSVKIRSDKSYTTYPHLILDGNRNVNDPDEISTLFYDTISTTLSTTLKYKEKKFFFCFLRFYPPDLRAQYQKKFFLTPRVHALEYLLNRMDSKNPTSI
jgi:hypothetical protein